jgi:hypothetical protein
MSKKSEDKVLAEETTTLPEGTVLSVYRMRTGKAGHTTTRLVALHNNMRRVEMTVDNISPHNMRTYLELVRRDIARRRAALTAKPLLEPVKPDSMHDFVLSMAFNGMFIFETLTKDTAEGSDANNLTPTKKVVQRRRKTKALSQVRASDNGTVRGSGKTQADSG